MNKRVIFFLVLLRSCALLAAIACPYALFCPRLQKDDPCRFAWHPDSYLQGSSIETQSEDLWNNLSLWLVK